jgi:hypothetical protein
MLAVRGVFTVCLAATLADDLLLNCAGAGVPPSHGGSKAQPLSAIELSDNAISDNGKKWLGRMLASRQRQIFKLN